MRAPPGNALSAEEQGDLKEMMGEILSSLEKLTKAESEKKGAKRALNAAQEVVLKKKRSN